MPFPSPDLLELTPQKDVLFIIRDWNETVGSQETPGVTGKFGLGVHKEAGQRLIEFCEENTLIIANTPFLQDFLELTPKKDVFFFIGDWNAKVGSQEILGVTSKFGLGVQNEAGKG